MNVPLLDLGAHHAPIRRDLLEAIERVLESNSFILGNEVARFEERIAAYCGASHAIGVSSGTDALLVSLMALGIIPGDEVITTPYSFFATAGSIVRLGAKPVLVDIEPVGMNINPDLIDGVVTNRTKAILPVHLYGQCADMSPILRVAERRGLAVVEDAAQAIGAEYCDGRRAGSMGTAGCFSFFPSKNLGALGDAGMVVCQDATLAEKLRLLRVHGDKAKYRHKMIGGNFRLDALQAAILNVKIDHLDAWTRRRQQNAERYDRLFKESGLLAGVEIGLPAAIYRESGVAHYHIFNQYVIRTRDRDRLRNFLAERKIGTAIYYPIPFHMQECFSFLGYSRGCFPESEKAAAETLALPIFPELTMKQQEFVVENIKEFFGG